MSTTVNPHPDIDPDGDGHGDVYSDDTRIAVIGLAGRFPDAWEPDEFWRNLCSGRISTREFTAAELEAAGVDERRRSAKGYVPVGTVLPGYDRFDAEFFGIPPLEAETMDPQQRIFLEVCWEALETAGHPAAPDGPLTGVYAGASFSTYAMALYLARVREIGFGAVADGDIRRGSLPDFLPAKTAYRLGLRGPAMAVQTACSSSLTAVHQAVNALLAGDCDLAIAGGAGMVHAPEGYLYEPGGIMSEDGRCRSFDAASTGTASGTAVGVVVLRRLSDALRDGDHIRAVIHGSAVNNDGAERAGFMAPSPGGVAEVVAAALRNADTHSSELCYTEAHGSGTALGDHVELLGLTEALRDGSATTGSCGLGSVKANIGHCGSAAGIVGLIKGVYIAQSGEIPPHPSFTRPRDPGILADSPFRIDIEKTKSEDQGRRILVHSMGQGGSNAAVVLGAPPQVRRETGSEDAVTLILSARSRGALDAASRRLADEIESSDVSLTDVAYTLKVGRRHFEHRRAVTGDRAKLVAALRMPRPPAARTVRVTPQGPYSGSTDLVDAWLQGYDVEWPVTAGARRVPLPTYPFERKRFWALDRLGDILRDEPQSVVATPAETATGTRPARLAEPVAAADELESELVDLWQQTFAFAPIGVTDEFDALGGTSLAATRMALEIDRRLGVQLNLHRVGGTRTTVRRIADAVRARRAASDPNAGDVEGGAFDGDGALIDADLELPLGASIAPRPAAGKDGAVLLTGATGFLGAFILRELIAAGHTDVRCLVRAEDAEHGRQRLREAAARWRLPEPDPARVSVVTGDLTDLDKVLKEHDGGRLGREVGNILHCAASVVFTEPYRLLRNENSLSTAALLRWARENGVPDFSLVSSLAACSPAGGSPELIAETRQQPLAEESGGYGIGKWVSERLTERAEKDGPRVRVFRPGLILGDSETGACNPKDMIWRLIAGSVAAGVHPQESSYLYMAPVDVVARAIATRMSAPGAAGRAFHLVGSEPVTLIDLFGRLEAAGVHTKGVPAAEWRERLAEMALETGEEILSAVALFRFEDEPTRIRVETGAWNGWLAEQGLSGAIDGARVTRSLDYLAEQPEYRGLLAGPNGIEGEQ
ncbi:MAG TPA: thioester reductase domain-containing protein [Actinospica sp.]|nr:thioester reductase domain-containing protein [Actinospica sp.]